MIFKKASLKNFEGICQLRKELATDPSDRLATEYAPYNEENDRVWIRKCLRSRQRIIIFVAEEQSKICAHTIVCIEKVPKGMQPYVTYRKKARLVHLYVNRFKRRMGIGKKLMAYTLKYLKKAGVEFVDLECYIGNEIADSLYNEIGFKNIFVVKRFNL